jgi:hypothetical protein
MDKFDPNLVFVNINKLKFYEFMEDHTLQIVLAMPSDFLSEELVETTHFANLFTKELVETNHYGKLFTKELVQLNTRGLTTCNLTKRKNNYSLFNQ